MGLKTPEPPEYSYTAHAILGAYNEIACSRRYEQGVPLPLDVSALLNYMEVFEPPCELHIFYKAIKAIDNKFIDKAHKSISKKSA